TPRARARVLIRLAPRQDVETAVSALRCHLARQQSLGAEVVCTVRGGSPGLRLDRDAPACQVALRALSAGYGEPAVAVAVGGSIPFTAGYRRAFGDVPVLVTAVQDPETRAHGYDESLDIEGLLSAMHAEALMLQDLATLDPSALRGC
ncbi:MAG: dipeptidase, partial [Mycobacteriales bacterium]